jgi:hypothetical protein
MRKLCKELEIDRRDRLGALLSDGRFQQEFGRRDTPGCPGRGH